MKKRRKKLYKKSKRVRNNKKTRKNKRYTKKRYSKKKYSKKLSGGSSLTDRENELLTKVEGRGGYCNRGPLPRRKKRNEQECNDRSEVCKWEDERCMKDRGKIEILKQLLQQGILDPWIEKRDEYFSNPDNQGGWEWKNIKEKGVIYRDPDTDINIITQLLKREAEVGSNVYLFLDDCHGSLFSKKLNKGNIKLNSNMNLLLMTSRGDYHIMFRKIEGSPNENFSKLKPANRVTHYLSAMEKYLEDGYNELFDSEGCMTQKGKLLLFTFLIIDMCYEDLDIYLGKSELQDSEITQDILEFIRNEMGGITHENIDIRDIYNIFLMHYRGVPQYVNKDIKDIYISSSRGNSRTTVKGYFKNILLKLYRGGENINDTIFDPIPPDPPLKHNFGVNILYKRKGDNKSMFVHLPLDKIERVDRGSLRLSDILNYLEDLNNLDLKFSFGHSSCRVDTGREGLLDDHGKSYWDPWIIIPYYPEFKEIGLGRQISIAKEADDKKCFIKEFEHLGDSVISNLEKILKDYDNMNDYYVFLSLNNRYRAFLDVFYDTETGSEKLYNFIKEVSEGGPFIDFDDILYMIFEKIYPFSSDNDEIIDIIFKLGYLNPTDFQAHFKMNKEQYSSLTKQEQGDKLKYVINSFYGDIIEPSFNFKYDAENKIKKP